MDADRAARAGRHRRAAATVLAVIAAHALLLRAGIPEAPPPGADALEASRRVQVRLLPPAALAPSPPADLPPPAPAPASPSPRVAPAAPVRTAVADAPPVPVAPPSPAAAPPAAGSAVPVYPTRLPAPGQWAYVLRRGERTQPARLAWVHDGTRYQARLEGEDEADGRFGWHSEGRLDEVGLVPERFVDRRGRRRDAANFDLAQGRIGYSGSASAQAMLPGGQDRLSVLLQLAAILNARRDPPSAGQELLVQVSGARGDAAVWRFEVQGPERVTLGDGSVRFALKLLREPAQAYDTRAEVWVDPAADHLPLRLRLRNGAHVFEMTLDGPGTAVGPAPASDSGR